MRRCWIMKVIVKLDDRVTLEVEGDGKEALNEAITFAQFPKVCQCGNKEGFYFTTNKDKDGNIYVNVKCPECEARAGLGSLRAGGYFWKQFEKYTPKESENGEEN